MRQMSFRLLMFVIISAPIRVNAQIIPDNTLSKPSIVNQSGNTEIITGGTVSLTNNLFHSFSQFSILPKRITQFQHESAIKNLLVRVTGNDVSNIDGKLETSLINDATKRGEANVFLLNPNGIIFGKDSSLNLGGSFIATTANSITFVDGGKFSVRGSEDGLLTVGVPIGLQFGKNPGSISSFSQLGLQVQNNKTLALIGSNLKLAGSFFSATPGNIELSAVGNDAQIDFNITNLTFDYKNVTSFTDITLTEGSRLQVGNGNIFIRGKNITIKSGSQLISTTTGPLQKKVIVRAEDSLTITGSNMVNKTLQPSGIGSTQRGGSAGANIEVTARNLLLSELGNITTLTNSEGRGGEITIKASEKVDLTGVKNNELNSGIFANSTNTGKAGSISISDTQSISLKDGAQILSISNNLGDSGNIILKATNFIAVQGAIPIDTSADRLIGRPTIVSTQAKGNGDAGALSIETKRLQVSDGAQISTSIQGKGNAGKIDINAEEIELSGVGKTNDGNLYVKPKDELKLENGEEKPNRLASAISSDARPNSIGEGADLQIKTDRLMIKDGAVIQSVTFGSGNAGDISITPKSQPSSAQQFITLQGKAPTPDDPFPSSIIAFSGGIPNKNVFSVPAATGKGGNITIDTPNLKLTDGALIALGSLNSTPQAKGAGEQLKITAGVISLDRAELNAETNFGNGGNIDLTANQLLLLRNGSKITTQSGIAQKSGNAGNIKINAPFIFAVSTENSDINANAFTGNGGNVNLTANSGRILGLEKRLQPTELSDITASSQNGIQGTITIANPDIDPNRGTVALPAKTNDPSDRIDQSCSADRNVSGQFTIGGQGGLPASPQTSSSITPISRLATGSPSTDRSQPSSPVTTIREAQTSQRLANGKIRFTSTSIGNATPIGLTTHCR
jgi:filamentous hemagglutinin family protein